MKRVLNSAIAVAIAFATLSLNPVAASAHDEVAGTNPVAGSTVQAGVIDVSVSFGEDIMKTQDNAGLVIEVLGPDGSESTTWSNGCVSVDGVKESTMVDLAKPGLYTVNWRSISSDATPTKALSSSPLRTRPVTKAAAWLSRVPTAWCRSR